MPRCRRPSSRRHLIASVIAIKSEHVSRVRHVTTLQLKVRLSNSLHRAWPFAWSSSSIRQYVTSTRQGALVAIQRASCTQNSMIQLHIQDRGAHTCAGIPRSTTNLFRRRTCIVSLPFFESTDRSLHLRERQFSIAPDCLRDAAC